MKHTFPLTFNGHVRNLWAIVLAGGEGARLRPLVARVCGDSRPKQYACLLDSRTMLRQTLDRVGVLVPPDRTVVVTMQSHLRYTAGEMRAARAPHFLPQPHDLGTAAGVLLPAHWIASRDRDAVVAVFPCDHYVSNEGEFRDRVEDVAGFVEEHPEWMVLFGAEAMHSRSSRPLLPTPTEAIRSFCSGPAPKTCRVRRNGPAVSAAAPSRSASRRVR